MYNVHVLILCKKLVKGYENNYQLWKYNTVDDDALFVKVKKKITINFRINFDTAIGPRALEMAFSGFQIWKFSGEACPHTPLAARAFGASKSFPYH